MENETRYNNLLSKENGGERKKHENEEDEDEDVEEKEGEGESEREKERENITKEFVCFFLSNCYVGRSKRPIVDENKKEIDI